MKKTIIKNNFFYISSVVLGGILGYAFHFIVGRNLSVSQYGELQSITGIMLIFGVFFSTLSYFVIKYSSVLHLHKDRIEQSNFLLYIKKKFRFVIFVFLIIFLLLSPLIKNFLHLDDYMGLVIICLSMFIAFYSSFYSNSIQGWSDFWGISVIGVILAIIKLLSGYFLANYFPSASVVIWSSLVSAVFGWILFRAYFWKHWPKPKEIKNENCWREKYFSGVNFRKSLILISFFSLGIALVSNADIIIVKNLATPEVSGYYGALSVLGKIILWINLAVAGVLFPDACSDGFFGKPVKKNSIIFSYAVIVFSSLFLIFIYYFFPEFIVGLLYGEKYLPVANELALFGLMAFFLSLLTLEAKMALARQDYRSNWILVSTFILMSTGIFFYYESIRFIIISVSLSFFLGWAVLLFCNLNYRIKYVKAECRKS